MGVTPLVRLCGGGLRVKMGPYSRLDADLPVVDTRADSCRATCQRMCIPPSYLMSLIWPREPQGYFLGMCIEKGRAFA